MDGLFILASLFLTNEVQAINNQLRFEKASRNLECFAKVNATAKRGLPNLTEIEVEEAHNQRTAISTEKKNRITIESYIFKTFAEYR